MVELRRNYETVLSWLQPVIVKVSSDVIHKEGVQDNFVPDLSELPNTKYRVPSGFVDELLDGLVISDRTAGCRSSLGSAPVLSDLPSTKYRVPSGFIDEMLNGLVISDRTLERCQPSVTSVHKLLNSL